MESLQVYQQQQQQQNISSTEIKITLKWEEYLSVVLVFVLVALSFLCSRLIHSKLRFLRFVPETGILMLLGLLLGLIYWLAGAHTNQLLQFDIRIFDYVILPVIIFEGGYSLKRKSLLKNMATVITYAVLGTLISTLFIGLMAYFFARYAHVSSVDTNNPIEALLFGSIVSAIDPVATLALLGEVFRVSESLDSPLIYNLIFGESIVNDAVAIVVFRILIQFHISGRFTYLGLLKIVFQFIYISLGSVAIGLMIGFCTALFFKYVNLKYNTTAEVLILIMMSLSSYFLAEAATLSGIMSLFVCAIICGRYVWYNLSEYSRLTTPHTFKLLSTAAESYVFLYLGISVFSFTNKSDWRCSFIVLAIVLCLIGRLLNIGPLSFLVNTWRRSQGPIGWRQATFMWWSGLRGAIAFVLALTTIDYATPNANVIVTTTLMIIFFSVWVLGATSLPLLKLLGLSQNGNFDEESNESSAILVLNKKLTSRNNEGIQLVINTNDNSNSSPEDTHDISWLKKLDRRVLRPILRKRNDKTNARLRYLILGGYIPSSLRIYESTAEEYDTLYERAILSEPTQTDSIDIELLSNN
jgi:sodium/hydrogen exchanger 8